jgi:hypothetical protein
LVQPRKVQEQKSIGADFSQRSSRRYQRSSRHVSPSPRMDIVKYCKKEITKKIKRVPGRASKCFSL